MIGGNMEAYKRQNVLNAFAEANRAAEERLKKKIAGRRFLRDSTVSKPGASLKQSTSTSKKKAVA